MKNAVMITALAAFLICSSSTTIAEDQSQPVVAPSAQTILSSLTAKYDNELREFLLYLRGCDKSKLSDQEIDDIVKRLGVIRETDPYQAAGLTKGEGTVMIFPNRLTARECIFRFQFQKLANSFRRLPMEERVDKIIQAIEHPPKEFEYDISNSLAQELAAAGKDAVPIILSHKPGLERHLSLVVSVLASIGDPQAIDYIIEVLKMKGTPMHDWGNSSEWGDSLMFARVAAAQCLVGFKNKRVISALVGALQDEAYQPIDRHLPQVSFPDHKPYIGRFFSIQNAASQSLSQLTGKNWGMLFNEDYLTWLSWSRSEKPETFTPASVQRSERDLAKLIEQLFHRRMSGRPNPWQPQNDLETADGIQAIAADLKPLGKRVIQPIVEQYHARIKETPLWKDELQKWTKELLLSLEWPEARESSATLN